MESTYKRLPECELEVMMVIWHANRPVTSAYISDQLPDRLWSSPTLLKFLSRLTERGFISCRREGKKNIYEAIVPEQEYVAREIRTIFRRLYGNSLRRMLTALYGGDKLPEKDLEELRQFLQSKTDETR